MAEPDWADLRAGGWLEERGGLVSTESLPSLAALLREVVHHSAEECSYGQGAAQARLELLAEVRRVVIDVRDRYERAPNAQPPAPPDDMTQACDEILKRLGAL